MALCNRLVKFPLLFKEGTDFMRSIKSGVVKLRFSPNGGAVVTELFADRF